MSSDCRYLFILFFPFFVSAKELSEVKPSEHFKTVSATQREFRPSIVKSTEVGWRESDVGADALRVRLNFDGVLGYGTKRKGFEVLERAGRLVSKHNKADEIHEFYSKLVDYKFESDHFTAIKKYLGELDRGLAALRRRGSMFVPLLRMRDERRRTKLLLDESAATLQALEGSMLAGHQLDLKMLSFAGLIGLKELKEVISRILPKDTMTGLMLEQQLLVNKYDRDMRLQSENAILGHVEYQRRISDNDRRVDQGVAVGVTLPFLGDETNKLVAVLNHEEKKVKLLRELRDHRSEHGRLVGRALRLIDFIETSSQQQEKESATLKQLAVKNLVVEEYAEALRAEFKHRTDLILLRKEVYQNFLILAKESEYLLDSENILATKR